MRIMKRKNFDSDYDQVSIPCPTLYGFHLFGLTQESLKTEDSDGTDKSWLDFNSFGTLREKRISGCGRVRLLKRAFVCPP